MDLGYSSNAVGTLLSAIAFHSHSVLAAPLVAVCGGLLWVPVPTLMEVETSNRLTRRCSEPRTVLVRGFESMPTSFRARAVADLVSR